MLTVDLESLEVDIIDVEKLEFDDIDVEKFEEERK